MKKVGETLTLQIGKGKEIQFTVRGKEQIHMADGGDEPEAESEVATPPSSAGMNDAQSTELSELRKQFAQMQTLLSEAIAPRQDEVNRISGLLRGAGLAPDGK